MEIEWVLSALIDREQILEYIAKADPQAAVRNDNRFEQQADRLMDFPYSGRPGRLEGTRELVIQQSPYILIYSITGRTVRILHVVHGAQCWPVDLAE